MISRNPGVCWSCLAAITCALSLIDVENDNSIFVEGCILHIACISAVARDSSQTVLGFIRLWSRVCLLVV